MGTIKGRHAVATMLGVAAVIMQLTGPPMLSAGGAAEATTGGRDDGPADTASAAEAEREAWLVDDSADSITVIDGYGNNVTIAKPVDSVISQGMGSFFAAIRAIHGEELVTASTEYVSRNSGFFPRISRLPSISSADAVDNERVLTLQPDVIHTVPFWVELFSEPIRATTPMLLLDFNRIEDYEILGAVIDRRREAEEFTAWVRSYTDIIDERIATLDPEEYQDVFVFYGGAYGQSAPPPYGTFGRDNDMRNRLIRRAGGRSITADVRGDWITVDPEWLIQQNPPVIIRECYIIDDTPELGYNVESDAAARELMEQILHQRPTFAASDAVRDGRVHLLYGDIVQDSWFIGLVYFATWLHPELFEDLDPQQMHQEYISRFQRLELDVRTQGRYAFSAADLNG